MKRYQRTSALLASSVALVLWGCSGEQVESGSNATGRGMERAGGTIQSAGKTAGQKLKEVGAGTRAEKVTNATGAMLGTGGEKTHELLEKGGEKLKDLGVSAGKAVDKAGEKIKEIGETAGEKLKDLKEKGGEKVKDLKEKAGKLLNKKEGDSKDKD
jgi:hypothetical protein